MTNNEIFTLVRAFFIEQIAPKVPGLVVSQSFQNKTEAAKSGPQLVMFHIASVRHGSPFLGFVRLPDDSHVQEQIQQYESTFQITALADQLAETLTPADLAEFASDVLSGDQFRAKLKAQGAGLLRIASVANPTFVDDRDENAASPMFEIVITHRRKRTISLPAINSADDVNFGIHRV